MTTWLTKPRAAVGLLLTGLLVVVLATRPWVTGRTGDAVLAARGLTVTGDQAAPGLVALALVCLAASVAVLTAGRRLRQVSAALLTLAALGVLALTAGVLRDPSSALAAGSGPGALGAGAAATTGSLTPWPWAALLAGALLTALGALSLAAGRRWEGLSSRFERPSADSPDVSAEGGADVPQPAPREATTWDALSEGLDPTDDGPPETGRPPT